jgi:sulfate transport system permease protein
MSPAEIWALATTPRVIAAFRVSFGTALIAAAVNAVFGLLVAWMLVRYRFPGHRLVDAMVDLPFALPTAVAGIALTALYAPNGWIGQLLEPLGLKVAFTPLGIVVALIFIGLPFVVRTVQPVLQDLEVEQEEAAVSLGASRWKTFARIIFPAILPALITGFAPSPAASASTARSSSSPATCRGSPKSCRCSSSRSSSSSTMPAPRCWQP